MDTLKKIIRRGISAFLMVPFLVALLCMAGSASAVTYNLTADVTSLTMPDSTLVSAWGFGIYG